jgi:hypothetical protein
MGSSAQRRLDRAAADIEVCNPKRLATTAVKSYAVSKHDYSFVNYYIRKDRRGNLMFCKCNTFHELAKSSTHCALIFALHRIRADGHQRSNNVTPGWALHVLSA